MMIKYCDLISYGCLSIPNIQEHDYYLSLAFIPLTIIASLVLVRDIVNLLTEGILQGLNFSEVTESLLGIDGVLGVRHLRIWALSMDCISLSVTLATDSSANIETILNQASALLKAKYDIFEYSLDTVPESRQSNIVSMGTR
uniref:Solute carrier family 30 member 8 n=1 Tax=Plectus sambesii TaxID=2011161 RepID=A0A914VR60_9BILA